MGRVGRWNGNAMMSALSSVAPKFKETVVRFLGLTCLVYFLTLLLFRTVTSAANVGVAATLRVTRRLDTFRETSRLPMLLTPFDAPTGSAGAWTFVMVAEDDITICGIWLAAFAWPAPEMTAILRFECAMMTRETRTRNAISSTIISTGAQVPLDIRCSWLFGDGERRSRLPRLVRLLCRSESEWSQLVVLKMSALFLLVLLLLSLQSRLLGALLVDASVLLVQESSLTENVAALPRTAAV